MVTAFSVQLSPLHEVTLTRVASMSAEVDKVSPGILGDVVNGQ